MRIAVLGILAFLALSGVAEAQNIEKEAGSVFTSILQVIVKWIFPICAAYCFLHGVIGKGVKRGEWDMAAVCTIAAVALALFPKLLEKLFGVNL